ncbi:MAG: hypothetical protein Q7Q71_14815, partial [Verrucomicrobiota bacterium JB023]|nr:hypothetical protein [Verrucomicrobiota bacterium JB023]
MMNASCADCGRIVAFRTQDPSEQAACRGCGSVVRRSKEMPGVAVGVRHQPEAEAAERAPARRKPEDAKVLTNSEGEPMEPPPIASGNPGNPLGQPDAIMGLLKELRDSVGRLEEGQQKLLARSLSVPEMPVSDKPIKSATGKGAWGPLAIKNPFPTTPFRSTEIALVPRSLEELESERSYFVPEEEPKTPLSESRELSSDFYSKFGLAELDLSDGVT